MHRDGSWRPEVGQQLHDSESVVSFPQMSNALGGKLTRNGHKLQSESRRRGLHNTRFPRSVDPP